LGTQQAQEFAERVFDVQEWLAKHPERLAKISLKETERPPVIVQDPCHLRHAQQCHEAVREVLGPVAQVVELDDEGLCCGAGGSFSLVHPDLSQEVRKRKMEAIARAGNHEVVSANPGCALHLEAAGAKVRHPLELLAEAIDDK
jgi:glycolate oxidase iron-sulfur subunit